MAAPNDTVSQRFALVDYDALNGKQQEIYNFQKATGVLASYGFDCLRLADDWNGADFLAHHMLSGETLKMQLKGRVTIAKKYLEKDIWILCPLNGDWLAIPHDRLVTLIQQTTPGYVTSRSWTEGGLRSMKRPSKALRKRLEPWLLPGYAAEARP